jgi:hypothetical protein
VQCFDDAACDNACDLTTKTCLPPPPPPPQPPACAEECIEVCPDGVEIIGLCENGECVFGAECGKDYTKNCLQLFINI